MSKKQIQTVSTSLSGHLMEQAELVSDNESNEDNQLDSTPQDIAAPMIASRPEKEAEDTPVDGLKTPSKEGLVGRTQEGIGLCSVFP